MSNQTNHETRGTCVRSLTACVLIMLTFTVTIGCASSQEKKHKPARPTQMTATSPSQYQLGEDDPTDPTAMALHDLAGQLLLFHATQRRMPASLEEFAGPSDFRSGQGAGIDPATRRLFLYAPDSPINPRLPGRVVLYQPLSQGARGRWALLVNDLASDGKVITYVQRVSETDLPRVKTTP
jgi:hypothetical protein